ncbi:uncharacterized protein LOC130945491 [Arachis stenosperma]|uniref:uncharacterized protein LOC130945491 n=1 Tax=Arachis stenosperma TaxID=217475 RepID=UPI0025ACD446|nr:uncharacterized protein LOC130945491 [Arachis stenosperma]
MALERGNGKEKLRVMPFGLKNAGATYQRLMDKVFHHQIGRNMEIYVDDMVAKTTQEKSHCDNLKEIFEQIRAYKMRLNPEKCAFGVQGEECEKEFAEFKTILSSPPVLQRPEVGKPLYLYLSISNYSISSALVIETGKTQQPVYFVSRVMQSAKQRLALKAQILADFVSELTSSEHNKFWELHVDRASSRGGSGAGIIPKEGDNMVAEQSLQFHFPASNNQAEYEALIAGLKLALNFQVQSLTAHCDSLLVVQQVRGEYQVKDPLLERYWLVAKDLISKFSSFIILHVHREKNIRADILSKLAATRADTQTSALSQLTLKKPSIELLSISINNLHDWRTPFLEYINTGGELYRRGISQPLLKCLYTDEAREVIDEVHEGVCGNHIGGRALAAKIVRTGYYWPTMKRDCITKVKTCDKCQKHEAISTKPAEVLHSMETNGQAEAANRFILQAIKRKLDNTKGEWAELIPEILWSYNTTIQTTTGETPFKLVYRSEVLIPVEVGTPTIRTKLYDEQYNTYIRNAKLDLVEEDRDIVAIKQRAMKQLAERKHNRKVVPRTFTKDNLVLRRTEDARQPPSHGKLAANWEGPF